MGVFHETVEIVNRTSKVLEFRYDGQDMKLKPNYDSEGKRCANVHNIIPKLTWQYAMNQLVLMGSENPHDPNDYESLVGLPAEEGRKLKPWNDCSFISDEKLENAPLTRVKLEEYLDDPSVQDIQVRGKKKGRRGNDTVRHDITPMEVRASA